MDWKSYAPEVKVAPVFAREGEKLCIELKDWRAFGMWEGEIPFPDGPGCAIRVDSDAPAALGNKAGVLACFRQGSGKFFSEDYLEPVENPDGTLSFYGEYERDEDVRTIVLKPHFKWAEGRVCFFNVSVTPFRPRPDRIARIVTTCLSYVPEEKTPAQRLERAGRLLERIGREVEKPDLILFTEIMPVIGLGLPITEQLETIPGPTTNFLSDWAKRLNCHIAAGIRSICDGVRHNSAALLGRDGSVVGVYHKVNLTWGESADGIIPGNTHPVFDLDFGKVGFSICWDNWFGENARMLRLNGCELMLVPIAGDGIPEHRECIWGGRASEQGMAAAFSPFCPSYDGLLTARIFNNQGTLVASTSENGGYAAADLNLSRRIRTRHLSVASRGEGRSLYVRERRDDLYPVPACEEPFRK